VPYGVAGFRPPIDIKRWRKPLVFVLLFLLSCWAWADDAATLDHYLQRLGLTDLRLAHQQQALDSAGTAETKAARARQLSDLYAQRLLEAADEPERFGELVTRVEKLIRDFPAVDSPQLQVMLLQAEYQRAEAKALHWIDEPTDAKARTEARELLAKVTPQLARHRQQLAKSLEELQSKADSVDEPVDSVIKRKKNATTTVSLEQELARLPGVLARALFFEGWADFFSGLLAEPSQQPAHILEAEKAFSQLLEVGTEEKLNLEPDSLGLQSVWRARSFMGLGATLSAVGKESLAQECFTALEHPSTAPAVREGALYWHLLALVGTHRWSTAQEVASGEFSKFLPGQTAGRTPACVLLVRTAWANPKAPPEAESLAKLGLEGLARLKQFDALTTLLAKYRPQPKASDGFYALWGKGRLAFAAAEKSKTATDYQSAGQWFQQALDLPEAKDDPVAAAQCRYSLAWCDYRTEKYDDAIRLFRLAAGQLKTLGDDSAVQAAWMVFTCYQQLFADSKDPQHQQEALEALADLKKDFPKSEQAQRADLMLARLNAKSDAPEAAVKTLAAVTPDSPNYLTARFELCAARHQLWSKSKGDAKATLAGEVCKDADTYLAAAPESEGVRRVRAALLATDVLMSGSPPDWESAAKYLGRIRTTGDKLRDDEAISPEYHYRRLQLAQHAKDETTAKEQAEWLSSHAAGSSYELPALVIVARHADEELTAASDAQKASRREHAIGAYSRLVKLVGESPDAIAAKKNALVANSKLAQYEFDAGRYSHAGKRLEEVVKAFPTDRTYLRRAGLAWFKAGELAKALPHWDTIVSGSQSASEPWYEAKYYQLACLAKTEPAAASKAWKQFKLLHPEVKVEEWKAKFAELEKTIQ
jgi:outer membrane protein assembly factor BamD (BamD/ComL family)